MPSSTSHGDLQISPPSPPAWIAISAKGKERATLSESPSPLLSTSSVDSRTQAEQKQGRRVSSIHGPRPLKSSSLQRSSTQSIAPFKSRIPFRNLFEHPRILRGMLKHVSWEDFHAFSSTCRAFRHLISHPEFRDAILVHFVPGYKTAMGSRDLQQYREVQIDMHDLTLLMIAQYLPLHKYPMHALSLLGDYSMPSSSSGAAEWHTTRFIALTQAHSRFILLLQSLVHSGSSPTTPEENDDLGGWTPPLTDARESGVRELTFPAPLSYFSNAEQVNKLNAKSPSTKGKKGHLRSKSASSDDSSSSPPRVARAAAEMDTLIQGRSPKRRLTRGSIFGGQRVMPPPPSSAPASLQYSSTWRRTLTLASSRPGLKTLPSISDDEGDGLFKLKLPQRRFASANPSTDSSLDSIRSSPTPAHTRSPTTAATSSSSGGGQAITPNSSSTSSSPHDLVRATSRFRAPILRVFVPCMQLDEFAISSCEEQLIDAGLWEHLSAGDVVCNFGYVPPPEADEELQSTNGLDGERTGHRKKWLIFNGYALVHYIPPAPPPIPNSITLPSPFYYSHILPPLTNPIYILSLPALHHPTDTSPDPARNSHRPTSRDKPRLQLSLVHVPTRVISPQSSAGYAVVKKYMWLGRIPYHGHTNTNSGVELPGEGWVGEWILETEGTREGKQTLIDALQAGPDGPPRRGLWQIVKEKSGKGKLWMRLLNPRVDPTELDFENVPSSSSSH
ncbi:hypothetical protein EIP91_003441 [Steccherinum ochraceum]|uniref:F-box domain-containing protein n=1 Tax=Steccherinum ochraceum TaxID=92696 RepID=A0A4R0RGT4_9APHY|nr:hypothetical protein EIP91_003441 [Steccherinum ochraceum]